MGSLDGVQSGQIGITLERPAKKSLLKFDAFQTFGLLAYFVLLYAVYAGFFTALLMIALSVRKDNFLHLNAKLGGSVIPDDAYTAPWIWIKTSMP